MLRQIKVKCGEKMTEILKVYNESTRLALKDGMVCIIKKIDLNEIGTYNALSKVDCEFVSKIYGIEAIDGELFCFAKYIEGMTLENFLQANGALDDITATRFAAEICKGLSAIHKVGVIHRDITPNNIIITPQRHAVIIDYSISREYKKGKSLDTQILGTQGFAAPEQFGFTQTDERTDIYSLGVLINYMKTLALPSEKMSTGKLQSIVKKATSIDSGKRYANAKQMFSELCKEEKGKGNKFYLRLPGYRSGNEVFKLLFIICVSYLALTYLVIFTLGDPPLLILTYFLIWTLAVVLPCAFLSDVFSLISRRKNKKKIKRSDWTYRILFAVISFFSTFIPILIIPQP